MKMVVLTLAIGKLYRRGVKPLCATNSESKLNVNYSSKKHLPSIRME